MTNQIVSVQWEEDYLKLLDQTKLPNEVHYLHIDSVEDAWAGIKHLQVRGAPAIGMTAAYGLYLGVRHSQAVTRKEFEQEVKEKSEYLASSRPTAVNLVWALDRLQAKLAAQPDLSVAEAKDLLLSEGKKIQAEDELVCRKIGEYALDLFEDDMGILTHCNAGGLATARYGTATSPFYLAKEKGWNLKVYADETRPVLQGARLTAFELQQAGIDVTLICDNMAAMVMQKGLIQAVIVGTDRVAANGDVANKIGTYGVAVLAKAHGIPFYVAAPLSSIDLSTPSGDDIPIEERDGSEITEGLGKRVAPEGISTFNPAFDITPHKYITAIITEKGIIQRDFQEELKRLFNN
jgi:methylthioribose-1-phosphate isomerase